MPRSTKKPELTIDEKLYASFPSIPTFQNPTENLGIPSMANINNPIPSICSDLGLESMYAYQEPQANISSLYGIASQPSFAEQLNSGLKFNTDGLAPAPDFYTQPYCGIANLAQSGVDMKPFTALGACDLAIQASRPTSLFFDTALDTTELFKTPSLLATDFLYKEPSFDSLKITELEIPKTSLTFSLEPFKTPEQIRIDDLEAKIEQQQQEIQELKKLLKDERKERKSVDAENSNLKELTKFPKALQYLSDLEEKITQTEEKVMNESTSDQSKDGYSCYG